MTTVSQPRARRTDPTTSHLAAQKVQPRAATIREIVFKIASTTSFETDGFTLRRMCARYVTLYGDSHPATDSSIRTRVHELVQEGYIEDTGERTKSPTGRAEIIWRHRP